MTTVAHTASHFSFANQMVSHHSRRIAASRLRWLHQCRLAKWRLGNLCSQIGPAATSRLSGASVEFVKYWRKKILNPNFHSGKQMGKHQVASLRRIVLVVCSSMKHQFFFPRIQFQTLRWRKCTPFSWAARAANVSGIEFFHGLRDQCDL